MPHIGKVSEQLGVFGIARRVLRERGVTGFWSGILVTSTLVIIEKFVYFFIYSGLKVVLEARGGGIGSLTLAQNLFIGYV